MGIKIMMTPEDMSRVARELIAKQVLGGVAKSAVKGPLDEHYFAVVAHKGVSNGLTGLSLADIAKLLSCQTEAVRQYITDHTVYGRARRGCKACNGASDELKDLIADENDKDYSSGDSLSISVLLQASSALGRRRAR